MSVKMEVSISQHKDLIGCNSMSLNCGGSLALLAGRRCYAVLNLANPDTLAYRETRQSKWEVVRSEWCPLDESCVAVAANNKGDSPSLFGEYSKKSLYFQLTC